MEMRTMDSAGKNPRIPGILARISPGVRMGCCGVVIFMAPSFGACGKYRKPTTGRGPKSVDKVGGRGHRQAVMHRPIAPGLARVAELGHNGLFNYSANTELSACGNSTVLAVVDLD